MSTVRPSGRPSGPPVQQPSARLAYDDAATPAEMSADCRVTSEHLRLARVGRDALRPAPGLRYEECPREVVKREIVFSEAAARIAGALHLQLDGDV